MQLPEISEWCKPFMFTCNGEHHDSEQPHPDQSSAPRICLASQTEAWFCSWSYSQSNKLHHIHLQVKREGFLVPRDIKQLSSKHQGKNKQPGMENSDLLRIIANKGHRHRPPEFVHLQPGWKQRGKDHPETQTRLSTGTTNQSWGGGEDRGVQQGCEEWGGQRRG